MLIKKKKIRLKGPEQMSLGMCIWRNFVGGAVAQGLYSGGTANSDRLNFFIIQPNLTDKEPFTAFSFEQVY